MKIFELSKELGGIDNKTLITFFKNNGYEKIVSHMQTLTDEQVELAREHFAKSEPVEEKEEKEVTKSVKKEKKTIEYEQKKFNPDDIIMCRSVTPWKLNALSVDKKKVYHWDGFGDIDYVSFKELQALRRTDYITKPLILIDDADLCYQWRRELGDTYKLFLGVEYPEEFFEKSDSEFESMLKESPDVLKEVIKVTAIDMIKNENYPTVQKLIIIDNIFGTCLKDFL